MACPEVGPALRDVLLDGHLRVTETHQTHLRPILRQHGKLLGLTRRALGLVVAAKCLALVVDHSFGKAYQPSGTTMRFDDLML